MEGEIRSGCMGRVRAAGRRIGLSLLSLRRNLVPGSAVAACATQNCLATPARATSESQHSLPPSHLFDHFVGNREQRRRNSQLEDLRGPQADHQLEFRRRLTRKLARLRTLEDAVHVRGGLPESRANVGSVGQQAPGYDPLPEWIDGGPPG